MRSLFESIVLASDLLILPLVFLTVTLTVGALFWLLFLRESFRQRLQRMAPAESPKAAEGKGRTRTLIERNEADGLVDRVVSPLHRLALPSEEQLRRRLRQRLMQAGYRSKRAFRIFLGLKVLSALLFPSLYLLRTLVVAVGAETMLILALLAAVGLYLPNMVLRFLIDARQGRILRALPDALDLMVICVEAGLGLDMTFKRVGDEIRPLCSDLSDEFYLVNREVRAGKTRDEAFRHMSERTGVREVHNLMTVLVQTSRFGTSIAKALRVHADAMRVRRRQAAEERAAKSAVKLVFPLVVFIFPAIFVVLAGPAAIRIMQSLMPALSGQ